MPVIDSQPMSAIYAAYTKHERAVHTEMVSLRTLAVAAQSVQEALDRAISTDGNANHYSLPKLNDELKWAIHGWELVRKYNDSLKAEDEKL